MPAPTVRASRSRRLSQGLSGSEKGSPIRPPIRLGHEQSHRCAQRGATRLRENKVTVTRNIATEACRQADNGDFLARVKRKLASNLRSPSRKRPDWRSRAANVSSMSVPYALVFDIGGGSTELIWSEQGRAGYEIECSLPFGVVNLAEHFSTDVIDHDCYETMVHEIARKLPAFCNNNSINSRVQEGLVQMLGTSGTVTTRRCLDLPYYSRSRIDGLKLKFQDISAASR